MASYLYDWLEVHDGQSEWLFPNLRKIDFASKFRYLRAKSGYEWPKLFNNLRVAASNRIARDYGERYLKPWLGHTVKTHTTNYKSITKADYEMVFGASVEHRGGSQEAVGQNASHKKSHKPLHVSARLATEYGYATPTGLEETLKTEAFDASFYKDGAALEQLVSILSALDPKELEKLLRQVQEE